MDFFIYGDQESFVAALGPATGETIVGQAHADIRTMFGLISPATLNDPWVAVVVPHELVHLVFDTAVRNPYRFPPAWINEGLAVYLSEGYSAQRRSLVEDAVRAKDLIPLDALGGQFPDRSREGLPRLLRRPSRRSTTSSAWTGSRRSSVSCRRTRTG